MVWNCLSQTVTVSKFFSDRDFNGSICGMIKQSESEFANIDLEIEPNKGGKSLEFF